jgi:hypothetical protein
LDRLFQNLEPFSTSLHFGREPLGLRAGLLEQTYRFHYWYTFWRLDLISLFITTFLDAFFRMSSDISRKLTPHTDCRNVTVAVFLLYHKPIILCHTQLNNIHISVIAFNIVCYTKFLYIHEYTYITKDPTTLQFSFINLIQIRLRMNSNLLICFCVLDGTKETWKVDRKNENSATIKINLLFQYAEILKKTRTGRIVHDSNVLLKTLVQITDLA